MIPYPGDMEYAATRLPDTVVLHKGVPVEVKVVITGGENLTGYYQHIGRPRPARPPQRPIWVHNIVKDSNEIVSLDDIDPTPVPLGYVNYQGVASYIARVPRRGDYKQGMRYNNIRSISGLPAQRIPYSAIASTIVNEFPTFTLCVKTSRTCRSIAWHRDWAIDNTGLIHYQGEEVGGLIEGRVALHRKKQYLQEALDESF